MKHNTSDVRKKSYDFHVPLDLSWIFALWKNFFKPLWRPFFPLWIHMPVFHYMWLLFSQSFRPYYFDPKVGKMAMLLSQKFCVRSWTNYVSILIYTVRTWNKPSNMFHFSAISRNVKWQFILEHTISRICAVWVLPDDVENCFIVCWLSNHS